MDPRPIIVHTDDGDHKPIANAWVYWRVGQTTTLLRSDRSGRLWKFLAGQGHDPTRPVDYTAEFTATPERDVKVYYSSGARPIPDAAFTAHAAIFFDRKVADAPPAASAWAGAVDWVVSLVSPKNKNVLAAAKRGYLGVPLLRVRLTRPREERPWPMLWELPLDQGADEQRPNFHTAGLTQGDALWQGNNLVPAENSPAGDSPLSVPYPATGSPQETIFIRPRERGLLLEGQIDQRATAATIQLFDEQGHLIRLRENVATDAPVHDDRPMTLGAAAGDEREFKVELFPHEPVTHFGPIRIVVWSDVPGAPTLGAFAVHLCGLQTVLVDDYAAGADGKTRGTIRGEAKELVIIDFRHSPQPTQADLDKMTRARRMVPYDLANEERPIDDADPASTRVIKPQMPLWMAELQLVGISQDQLSDLMARCYFLSFMDLPQKPPTVGFNVDVEWDLILSWSGPDGDTVVQGTVNNWDRPNQGYRLNDEHVLRPDAARRQRFELQFNSDGVPCDETGQALTLGANKEVPEAQVPAPAAATFPRSGRRLPAVLLGAQRPWGRVKNASSKDSIVFEYQPLPVDPASGELIRGGDGRLTANVKIAAERVNAGSVPPIAAGDPDLRLPRFRVRGVNPSSAAQRDTLVNAIVHRYYQANGGPGGDAWVNVLTEACWQETMRRVIALESQLGQFDTRTTAWRREEFRNPAAASELVFGHELDMPLFGPPHGYGMGQLDLIDGPPQRPANDDEVWSFVKNLETAVALLIGSKGRAAYNYLSGHIPNPVTRDFQAVFRRDVVRRNNGGREFIWSNNQWMVSPSLPRWKNPAQHRQGPYPNLLYCNQVLGTAVTYWTYNLPAPPAPPAPAAGPGGPPAPAPPPAPPPVANHIERLQPQGQIPNSAAGDQMADQRYQFGWPVAFINAAATNYGPGL